MFYYASAFNQPMAGWEVGQVTSMEKMFSTARAFDQPVDSWDVGQVTTMQVLRRLRPD